MAAAAEAETEGMARAYRPGDSIVIAGCIEISVIFVAGNKTKLKVKAPKGMSVLATPGSGLVSTRGAV